VFDGMLPVLRVEMQCSTAWPKVIRNLPADRPLQVVGEKPRPGGADSPDVEPFLTGRAK